jgi:hypothetical protein
MSLIIDDGGTDDAAEVIAPVLQARQTISLLKRPELYIKGLPGYS